MRTLLIALCFMGCTDDEDPRGGATPGLNDENGNAVELVSNEAPTTAVPRASRREIESSIRSVFGITGAAIKNLPADPQMAVSPKTNADEEVFDTLTATKAPSQVFVEGLESLAFEVARDFSANRAAVNALAGCTPAAAAVDGGCLGKLVDNIAMRLWRRKATDSERQELLTMATPFGDHYVAVRAVVAAMIQHPEFAYRSEIGSEVAPGVARLGNGELLGRLAAFLWGSAPSAEMVAALPEAPLDNDGVTRLVDDMMRDERARTQMRAFHELWLRYTNLLVTDAALATDMRAETDALVERALSTPGTPWGAIFTSTQTFVTPRLAAHYGLPSPASPGWVETQAPRAGILSHGSFLSLSSTRINDTLPSRRGTMIARRLLCKQVRPPPKNVNIDNGVAVPPGACKSASYSGHASAGACAGCHAAIDGIGFGFERFDGLGRYREKENDNPNCAIDGAGRIEGQAFSGAREFVAQEEPVMTRCAVENLLRFAFRDRDVPPERVVAMEQQFSAAHGEFRALMRSIAIDPRFRLRVMEVQP